MNESNGSASKPSTHNAFAIVLSVAVVAGMVVALALIGMWRSHSPLVTTGMGYRAAVAVCPPFLLVGVMGAVDETALSLLITSGAIVVGNTAMYGGVAAFAYWAMTTFLRRAT